MQEEFINGNAACACTEVREKTRMLAETKAASPRVENNSFLFSFIFISPHRFVGEPV
jgi:hypothetical protein